MKTEIIKKQKLTFKRIVTTFSVGLVIGFLSYELLDAILKFN